MDTSERQRLDDVLAALQRVEANLPAKPEQSAASNKQIGGYFYHEWSAEFGRWVDVRSALHDARELVEGLLETKKAS